MKKALLFLLLASIGSVQLWAQGSGEIVFEEKVKLQFQIEGDGAAMMADLPKEKTSEMRLVYTPEASYYTAAESSESNTIEQGSEENKIVIQMDAPFYACLHDLTKQKVTEQRDFMTRMFLVESNYSDFKWKLTGNQKEILGYPCQEATLVDSTQKTVAWFTASIPVSSGPMMYCNLPGMILEASRNDGEIVWTAVSVKERPVTKEEMPKPKEGKKVTRDEFRAIIDEKMKEMEQEYGGSGGKVIMRIEDDRQ